MKDIPDLTEKKRNAGKYKFLRKLRWIILPAVLILANSHLKVINTKKISSGFLKSFCVPFMNCHSCPAAVASCPIGIVQYSASMRMIPFFLLGFLGLTGIIFGRAACGWLCPFGYVQDLFYKIRSKKIEIPKVFTHIRWIALIGLSLILPFLTSVHWYSKLCPWGTAIAGIPWGIWNPIDPVYGESVIPADAFDASYWLKIGILLLFLVMFIISKRPFCRTFCPLGLIYSFFNRISFMQMKVKGDCIDCDRCKKVCPMDIKISDNPSSQHCIRCLKCTICKNVSVGWGVASDS